jgi:hypothetical protein
MSIEPPTELRSKTILGLTEELAAVPIRVGDGMMSLHEAASWLYDARRESNPDEQKAVLLAAELDRLRREAERVGDGELVGAADALEQSARAVWTDQTGPG